MPSSYRGREIWLGEGGQVRQRPVMIKQSTIDGGYSTVATDMQSAVNRLKAFPPGSAMNRPVYLLDRDEVHRINASKTKRSNILRALENHGMKRGSNVYIMPVGGQPMAFELDGPGNVGEIEIRSMPEGMKLAPEARDMILAKVAELPIRSGPRGGTEVVMSQSQLDNMMPWR